MNNIKGFKPILLMDDIFDKLDQKRVEQIMVLVSENNFGQIFITDTQHDRIEKAFSRINTHKKFFSVNNGQIEEVSS